MTKKFRFRIDSRIDLQIIGVVLVSITYYCIAFGKSLLHLNRGFAAGDGVLSYSSYNSNGVLGESSPHIGYPFGQDWKYFPSTSLVQSNMAHWLSWLTKNSFIGFNLVYLISFPVCALLVIHIFRLIGAQSWVTFSLAVGFTFLPFHFYRMEHQELSTLYSLPLGLLIAVAIGSGRLETNPLFQTGEKTKAGRIYLTTILIGCLVLAFSGLYDAFFSLILMTFAGIYRFSRSQCRRDWLLNLLPIVTTCVGLFLALLPTLVIKLQGHQLTFGRLPLESVAYSGQLMDAIFPTSLSRIPGVSALADSLTPINNWANALGAPGVRWIADQGSVLTLAGAIFLFFSLFINLNKSFGSPSNSVSVSNKITVLLENIKLIGVLVIVVILFLVPFGLNEFFAAFISPQIRAWDRIIPLFQLLLIIGLGIIIELFLLRPSLNRFKLEIFLIPLILYIILLDTVIPARPFIASQLELGTIQMSTAEKVVNVIETKVSKNCAVLQLPYIHFPESAPLEKLGVYTPLWLPLVSKHNMWSYGGIYGSKQDVWVKAVSDNPIEFLSELKKRNFCAIEVATDGYKENDLALLKEKFARQFGTPLTVDGPPKFLVYKI